MQDGLRKSYHAQHFTASQQDAWLWFVQGSRAGATISGADAPFEDSWPKSCPALGIPQQVPNLCQRQDRAAFQTVDLGWGSRFKVWAWELWLNNSLAKKRSPGSSWHAALFSRSCSGWGSRALSWYPCAAFSLLFVLCFVKGTAAISFADLCNSLTWTWIFWEINPCILSQYFNVHLQIIFYFRNIREYFGGNLNVALK